MESITPGAAGQATAPKKPALAYMPWRANRTLVEQAKAVKEKGMGVQDFLRVGWRALLPGETIGLKSLIVPQNTGLGGDGILCGVATDSLIVATAESFVDNMGAPMPAVLVRNKIHNLINNSKKNKKKSIIDQLQ